MKEKEEYKEYKPYVGDESLFDSVKDREPIDFSRIEEEEHRFRVMRIPDGIEVLKLMSELEISINWRNSAHMFSLMFSLLWNFLVITFVLFGLLSPNAWGFIPFLIPFIVAGVWLFYDSIANLVNTTYIRIKKGAIDVEHRPLKSMKFRDRKVLLKDIKQFYTKKYVVGTQNEKRVYAYAVWLKFHNGKEMALIKGLKNAEYGQYLEHQIETYIGMKDFPVRGEIPHT